MIFESTKLETKVQCYIKSTVQVLKKKHGSTRDSFPTVTVSDLSVFIEMWPRHTEGLETINFLQRKGRRKWHNSNWKSEWKRERMYTRNRACDDEIQGLGRWKAKRTTKQKGADKMSVCGTHVREIWTETTESGCYNQHQDRKTKLQSWTQ